MGKQKCRIAGAKKTKGRTEFTLKLVDPPENLEVDEVELLDADGNEIPCSRNKMRAKVQDQPVTYELTFHGVEAPSDVVPFQYKVWPDILSIHVPFKLAAPIATAGKAAATPGTGAARPAAELPPPQKPAPAPPPAVEPPPQPEPDTAEAPAAAAWPSIKVSGVMGKGAKQTAMINGQIVGAGETVAGVTIVSIANGVVTLKYQGKTATLKSGGVLP